MFRYVVFTTVFLVVCGCGPSEEEIRAKVQEEMRIEAEKKIEREKVIQENLRIEKERKVEAERLAAEKARKEKEDILISNWKKIISDIDSMAKSDNKDAQAVVKEVTSYMIENQRGIVFKETQFEVIGFLAFAYFKKSLGIPDYIVEKIKNTRPIDGSKEDKYGNIEINWSIGRDSSPMTKATINIYLRLIDEDA